MQVVENHFHNAFLLGTAEDGLLEKHAHHVGEERKNVQAHIIEF